ncbi:hypothetical protein [Bradyrhizobium sp.]|uniref:hypothetical protein n=1 Tax=Bradyrhizobium sp. TaxID=376 RepID=UPI003BB142FE
MADVVSEIINHGKPPPLTDEEREQRRIDAEIHLWECHRRDEERQAAYQREQAIKAEAARREAAIAAEQEKTGYGANGTNTTNAKPASENCATFVRW